jgi:autoinducer 2-degrading protein
MSFSKTCSRPTGPVRENSLDKEFTSLFTLDVKPGQFTAFKALVAQIVAATSEEPGVLTYQYSVSADSQTAHILERYANSAAFVSHVEGTFAGFAERFLSFVSVRSLVIHGDPDGAARKGLDAFGAIYMTRLDGFSR